MEQLQPMREDVEILFDLDWDDESDTAVWTPPPEVLRVIERAKTEPGPLLA